MYKRQLTERFPSLPSTFVYALSAVAGDLTGSIWLCPSEVVKQQSQAGLYATTTEALQSIWMTSGLAGLYQGYWGGVSRDVPFRVAQLTLYELTKNLYIRMKKQKTGMTGVAVQLSSVETAVCGAVAGSVSAAITSPLDRLKTLLMTDAAGAYGPNVWSCAATVWRQQGVEGFTAGMLPRVVYIAPSVALFFIVYEQIQQAMDQTVTDLNGKVRKRRSQ